jgi:hypothetical protein
MDSWKSFEREVAKSIRANSIIFLRRAADEIVRHDDGADKAFDHETGTVVTVLTQMALELAAVAYLVEHDKDGIRSIIENGAQLSNEQIREKWLGNSLRTKKFEENKKRLSEKHEDVWGTFEGMVDSFQRSRNKIVHIHFHFMEGDLYDLKFESIFVLMHVVANLIYGNKYDHAENIAKVLSSDTLKKLVGFRPYQDYVEALAIDYASPALRCIICDQRAFSAGYEHKCFSCGYEDINTDLLDCLSCRERSVVYDNLNLHLNKRMNTLCLNCGETGDVSQCKFCETPFLHPAKHPYCSQDCIEDEKSKMISKNAV